MITNLTCVGLRNGKTKTNKPFARVYFDITDCVINDDNSIFGTLVQSFVVWDKLDPSIVGKDVLCSVDKFGNILDIEYYKERSSS